MASRAILPVLLLMSCENQNDGEPLQVLPEIRSLGQRDEMGAPDFFGRIMDLKLDSAKNLYVLDSSIGEIRAFTWSGDYVRSYGSGIGDGPGEIRRAFCMAVSNSGHVYVSEHLSTKVNLFRPTGDFSARIDLPFAPGALAITEEGQILATRWALVTSPRVALYSLDEGVVREAVEPDDFTELVFGAGFVSQIDVLGSHFIVARPFPYELTILDSELNTVRTWNGPEGVVNSPPERLADRQVYWKSMVYNVVAGLDSLIYVLTKRSFQDAGLVEGWLDIFTWYGSHVLRIPHTIFGHGWIQRFEVDEWHVMVAAVDEPYPALVWFDLGPMLVQESTPKR